MEIFKELESLGFFKWLQEKRFVNGFGIGFTRIILENQPIDSIERTSYNAIAFKFFREKYGLSGWINESIIGNSRQGVISIKSEIGLKYYSSTTRFCDSYEEAEFECIKKLIEIVNDKSE